MVASDDRPFDWKQIQQEIVHDPDAIYLNTGSYGLPPWRAFRQLQRDRERLAKQPVRFLWREFPERLWQARETLARFLGVSPHCLPFMVNVTAALNTVGLGLTRQLPGDILLTDQEYGAMVFLWQEVARRHGVRCRVVELPSGRAVTCEEVLDRFRAGLNAGPVGLVFVSHVTYMSGMLLPVREIVDLARAAGAITVVDGAHAPGMFPLDVASVGCDFYGGNCHKWLLAPINAGFLWVRPGCEDWIRPIVVSWGWEYERDRMHERNEYGSTPWLRAFEFQGTRDPCPWLAVPQAIAFQEHIGRARIWERVRELARIAREVITRPGWIEPWFSGDPSLYSGVTGFRLAPEIVPDRLQQYLWDKHKIIVPAWELPIGKCLRVSTHVYNSPEQLERLAHALDTFRAVESY